MTATLKVMDVTVRYGEILAVQDISLSIPEGGCYAIVGANGAGKTTLVETIAGLVKPSSGKIFFEGEEITSLGAEDRAKLGIGITLEGRRLFPDLSVDENLRLATHILPRNQRSERLESAYDLFDHLRTRRRQRAGTLSGGEQQMLALARTLLRRPRLLLLDEPSLGLAPWLAARILKQVLAIDSYRMAVLIAEQNTSVLPDLDIPGCFVYHGKVIEEGTLRQLLEIDGADIQARLQEKSDARRPGRASL